MSDQLAETMKAKIASALPVELIETLNESHRHAGPATNSHYNLTVVSQGFSGLTAVKRHQQIYRLLAAELAGPVHALALHLYTPEEWKAKGMSSPDSPDCRGAR